MALIFYQVPDGFNFTRNPIMYVLGTDTPVNTAGLYVKATIETSRVGLPFEEAVELPLMPDANGFIRFDARRIADAVLTDVHPEVGNVVAATTQTGRMRITFQEFSITTPNGANIHTVGECVIIKGGIDEDGWNGNNYFTNILPTKKVLSWESAQRYITTWQKQWISFFRHVGGPSSDWKVKVKVYYTDGTNQNGADFALPSITFWTIYHIPVDFATLGIAAVNPSKQVWYYKVQIFQAANPESEELTFFADNRPNYERIQIGYFNSLGGFDVAIPEGQTTESSKREIELTENALGTQMHSLARRMTYKTNMGNTDSRSIQNLRGSLELSRKAYVITNRMLPIVITDTGLEYGALGAQLNDLTIEWQYARLKENFSPEGFNFGSPTLAPVACPAGTINVDQTAFSYTFAHTAGSVVKYTLQISQGLTIVASTEKSVPFTNPLHMVVGGLVPETAYSAKLIMHLDNNTTTDCDLGAFTTDAASNPLPGMINGDFSTPADQSARISAMRFAGMPVYLDPPSAYALYYNHGAFTAKSVEGNGSYEIDYFGFAGNTITLTDSDTVVHTAIVSGYGTHIFTGVVINTLSPVTLEITD